ncbi:DUF6941 family protein [Salinicoccus roseus]|uniref:DUF6941 family protein n=1 Tax=Salinicoccus roseus TaxID=45670 RepID=UPI003564003F
MAKIAWAVISSGTFNNPNNQMVIDNPLPLIKLDNFPNNFSFSLAFSIIELNESREYKLKIVIGNDSGDELLSGDLNINHEFDKTNINDVFVSDINVSNLKFPKPGLHHVELTLDDSKDQFRIYFLVRKVGDTNVS